LADDIGVPTSTAKQLGLSARIGPVQSMSTPKLVEQFYARIWNAGDLDAASDLLTAGFSFRGSLGTELSGHKAFEEYVRSVRGSLSDYRCEILTCVAEGERAFAKMRFSGRHTARFRGYEPTGKSIQWLGAALFRFEDDRIAELWVLGDLTGLDVLLDEAEKVG
jgi:predicted ester cyclase